MKTLLVAVNAKYIHSCPAVYSLKATAQEVLDGYSTIVIAEYTINDRYQDILADLIAHGADVIGFSCYIWNASVMQDLMRDVRKILGDSVLMFAGGPEATYHPHPYVGPDRCDFVMGYEGEMPFRTLIKELQQGHVYGWKKIPGVMYLAEGDKKLLLSAPPEMETDEDIDRIPFLYSGLEAFENRIIYYESSRGCPFHCSYCLSSVEEHVRFRNLEAVKKELQYFLDSQVAQVKFVDRTFNCSPKRAYEIWHFLKEHDNGVTNFHFEISADLLNEEQLKLLRSMRPALVQLEIGIQTTNPKAIEAIHRSTDLNKLERAVSFLREKGNMNLHVDLIAGLPYEGYESFRKSFNDVYPLHANMLQLGFLKVLNGTEMYKRAEEYGLLWSERPPYEVLRTNWLTYKEICRLQRIADVLDSYYNSQQFIHSLEFLETCFKSPFDLYANLAEYYIARGLFHGSVPARQRYGVLADFGRDYMDHARLAVFENYLRFDQELHYHQSRRMEATDTFDFGQGHVTIHFDYSRKNPVNGEANYYIEAQKE